MKMPSEDMAEARPETPKKYSCACGLSQEDRKKQFSGKCRHCHTRPKFLIGQSSFDSGSASRGCNEEFPPTSTALSTCSTLTATTPTLELSSPLPGSASRPGDCSCRPGRGRGASRSRSVERYDIQQLIDNPSSSIAPPPPPYVATMNTDRGHTGGRSARRDDVRRLTQGDHRLKTPPPTYEAAQNLNPPSYEEALANSLSGLSTSSRLSALIATTPDLRAPPSSSGRHSSLFHHSPISDHPRGVQRTTHREAGRQLRRVQRQAEREAQLERERQLELDIERERQMELQVARYCGCSKCQELYYRYYYEDHMNDGTTFPMETQVLMQEVLADGLAFCSVM